MKRERQPPISRHDGPSKETGFADLVEGTLTGDRFETVLIEKGAPLVTQEDGSRGDHAPGPGAIGFARHLDLHGMTVDEARRRTVYFLQNCRHQGLRQVRVITGKGLHSDGGAVLPEAIEQTLLGMKRQGEIDSYQWEKGDRSRSGALVVRLLAP